MEARLEPDRKTGGAYPELARSPSDRSPVNAGADVDPDYRNDDNVTPVLTTAVLAAPILAVCCLGPIFYSSVAGWLGGIGPMTARVVAVIVGILARAFTKRRKANRAATHEAEARHPAPETQQTNWSSR